VLAVGLWTLAERPNGWRKAALGASFVLGASLLIPALTAMQVLPTWRLAALASAARTPDYRSGFASTPLHLVSLVAPGLFHRSPLWRPLVWDPFHTSPEENLVYVGLVPLFLALAAAVGRARSDGRTRLLLFLGALTLVLSFGPYAPGFSLWSQWPGFSFFRAPARWSLATSLALALLAGQGFDLVGEWPRPGRALAGFSFACGLLLLAAIAVSELSLAPWAGAEGAATDAIFDGALRLLPWSDRPALGELRAKAHQPQNDIRVRSGLAREGYGPVANTGERWDRQRWSIYGRELRGTAVLVAGLLLVATLARGRLAFLVFLLVLTGLDLIGLGRVRNLDFGPISPLVEQSRVLHRLADAPQGTRTADGFSNLAMVAGVAPIGPYRTLDLPVLAGLTARARERLTAPENVRSVQEAMRAAGAELRILDTSDLTPAVSAALSTSGAAVERVRDPEFSAWLFG
jgi:hypothetical protein